MHKRVSLRRETRFNLRYEASVFRVLLSFKIPRCAGRTMLTTQPIGGGHAFFAGRLQTFYLDKSVGDGHFQIIFPIAHHLTGLQCVCRRLACYLE